MEYRAVVLLFLLAALLIAGAAQMYPTNLHAKTPLAFSMLTGKQLARYEKNRRMSWFFFVPMLLSGIAVLVLGIILFIR